MRTKECEVQYNLARYERERKAAENEQIRSRTLTAQVSTFSQTETELRSQLNIYVEKFKQVRKKATLPTVFYEASIIKVLSVFKHRSKTRSTTPTTFFSLSEKKWKKCPERPSA